MSCAIDQTTRAAQRVETLRAPGHARSGSGYAAVKRAVDVVLSAAGLAVLWPVIAAAAIAVKATSPGPVLFRQTRVGRAGRPFEILKLRSMRDGSTGPSITASHDPRVTPVGRFLRRTKLDELPQLWNVLAGDMSLVGPRPELPRFVARFAVDYARILSVRPGLTDYAALAYRDEEAVLAAAPDPEDAYVHEVLPAKIRLYHRYIDEMSLETDLALVFRTVAVLLR